MPTSTFFRLPVEKRTKLLRCARAEFARVPYSEASINRIIRAAEIPRGSFYMYFSDKGDLFRHLLGEYRQILFDLLSQLLSQRKGDPFEAFLDFFDLVQTQYSREHTMEDLISIFQRNAGLPEAAAMSLDGLSSLLEPLCGSVDASLLQVERAEDVRDMLQILMSITAPMVRRSLVTTNPEEERAHYSNLLSILRRGMAKESAPHVRPS